MKLLLMQFSPFTFHCPPHMPRYISQQPIVFQPQRMFLLSVGHQDLHPHETMGRIIVLYLYIVIFILWDIKLEDRHFWTEL
jgi:hypothetical protein